MSSLQTSAGYGAAFLRGAITSVVIFLMFHNLHVISDNAPAAIRESETPGLLGVPIAIIIVVWIILTAVKFTNAVLRHALAGQGLRYVRPILGWCFCRDGALFWSGRYFARMTQQHRPYNDVSALIYEDMKWT